MSLHTWIDKGTLKSVLLASRNVSKFPGHLESAGTLLCRPLMHYVFAPGRVFRYSPNANANFAKSGSITVLFRVGNSEVVAVSVLDVWSS